MRLFAIATVLLALGCSAPTGERKDAAGANAGVAASQGTAAAERQPARDWNELAILLSGTGGAKTTSPAILKHRKLMQAFWLQVKRENLEPIAKWRDANIPASARGRNVLYPLSGADFLNAYALYPDATEYLLIALEPPGTAPDLEHLAEADLDEGLTAERHAILSLANDNYLQSKVMLDEFANPHIGGTLPAFLIMLGGLGHHVDNVEEVGIGADGAIAAAASAPRTKGIRISFHDAKDGQAKTLVYLQMRLGPETVDAATPEGRYLHGIGQRNTMLKSAVYLFHQPSMKPVADLILAQSALVIEDDSGLPYKSFQDGQWDERVFGVYSRAMPVGDITHPPQQPDMAARYAKGAESLPFAYGYGILRGKDKSNLMMFWRR
jgi:hypothetical protein